MLILLTNVDQKSLETEELGDKWQSKTLFLVVFDPCLSIVRSVFDCPLSGVSKTCLKRPLKNRANKELMTNGSLMKVKSIAECSPCGSALSDNRS